MTAEQLLKNTEPLLSHTVSQKALIVSVRADCSADYQALADQFGVSRTQINHAVQVVKQRPDLVPVMLKDKNLTVSKVYRQYILKDRSYNKR